METLKQNVGNVAAHTLTVVTTCEIFITSFGPYGRIIWDFDQSSEQILKLLEKVHTPQDLDILQSHEPLVLTAPLQEHRQQG